MRTGVPVSIPKDELIQSLAGVGAKILEKGDQIAGIASFVYTVVKDWLDPEVQPPPPPGATSPDAGTPPPQRTTVVVNVTVNVGGVSVTTRTESGAPADVNVSVNVATPPEPNTTVPVHADDGVVLTPEPVTITSVVPDETEEEDHLAQDDGRLIVRPNPELDAILRGLRGMTFSDAATADAYLRQRTTEAGIEFRLTERGVEVVETMPDPAQVAARLVSRGMEDADFIKQVVSESNSALHAIESFVQTAEATVAGAAAVLSPQVTPPAEEPPPLSDVFHALVPTWASFVPPSFSVTSSVATNQSPPSNPVSGTSAPTQGPGPVSLLAFRHQSSTGLEVAASVNTEISLASDGGHRGLSIGPFVSVFDHAPSWTLRA